MKIILLLIAVMLLMVGAEARYSPGLEIATGENITLDGGFIKKIQTDGVFNILAYGATPNDFSDDAEAIQDCYDAAHLEFDRTGHFQVVNWPPGEFNGNTSQSVYTANNFTIISPRPGVITQGSGMGATIFRAKDNFRDSTHGVYLFRNDLEQIDHLTIRDITFEYGNNTVEPGESNWTSIGAEYCSNVVIENVEVLNVSGTHGLQFGALESAQNNTNAYVSNIHIYNAQGSSVVDDDTYDHTSVRFDMDNVIFRDSILECESKPDNAAGFEFHGNNSVAFNLKVINYTNGANIGADQYPSNCTVTGQHILLSLFTGVTNGVTLWSTTADSMLSDVLLVGNKVVMDASGCGVVGISHTGGIRSVNCYDNDISSTNSGVWTYGGLFEDIDNINFQRNNVHNTTNGFYVLNTEYIETYDISDNNILHWGYGVTNGQHSAGLYIEIRPTVDGGHLVVNNNHMNGYGYPYYGIFTYCPNLMDISIRDNDILGCAAQDIVEAYTWRTDEDLYIEHSSHAYTPLSSSWAPVGAKDGSIWTYQGNGTLYRKDTTWKEVDWTYV